MHILRDLRRIYRRYISIHGRCSFTGIALDTGNGVVGYVEECTFAQDRIKLRGWTLLHRLRVEVGGTHHPLSRRIHRGDVVAAKGAQMIATGNQHGRVGFELTLPRSGGNVRLVAEDGVDNAFWDLPLPDKYMIRAEKRRVRRKFLRDVLSATPLALRYLIGGRRRTDRERVRALMGFGVETVPELLLNPDFLRAPFKKTFEFPETTIIVPVYNAFELLTEVLDRVERHTDVPWHLILIEDVSTDQRVRPWLSDWTAARADRVTLLLNEHNQGFVRSVNRGLDEAAKRDGPVILLNSDALVPEAWASRLLQPLLEDSTVASVTPMSNDATILSVPWNAGRLDLKPSLAAKIDAAAQTLSPYARAVIPTGVGFCMAMSPHALKQVPTLDVAFGRGYGEEVDWCRKTAAAGMIHLGIGNLFVEHRGGESFGNDAKMAALESSTQIINSRYPEFVDQVHRFIETDPLLTARLALGMRWAAEMDPDPIHIYLGHSLGGGAEHWLASRISERSAEELPTIVIRIGGERRFRIELHAENGLLIGETEDISLVRNLLSRLPRRRMVYSCGVGDERPWELPKLLCDLSGSEGSALEILFHDYFPISPSLNLLNADGRYTGVPPAHSDDAAHQIVCGEDRVPLSSWRAKWGAAIRQADRLTVFSANSAEIVASVWPEAEGKIVCQPHRPLIEVPVVARRATDAPEVIGILGAIGEVKGARIVSDLAYHLDRLPNAPKLVVIGEFDHSFPLPASVKVTGRYDSAALPRLLAGHNIQAWLMPSIWPETFSFTTQEMLATGLPVMAFDLGAQGDAVGNAKNGHIVSPDPAAIYDCYQRLRRIR